jgi:hypothetical protein
LNRLLPISGGVPYRKRMHTVYQSLNCCDVGPTNMNRHKAHECPQFYSAQATLAQSFAVVCHSLAKTALRFFSNCDTTK